MSQSTRRGDASLHRQLHEHACDISTVRRCRVRPMAHMPDQGAAHHDERNNQPNYTEAACQQVVTKRLPLRGAAASTVLSGSSGFPAQILLRCARGVVTALTLREPVLSPAAQRVIE